jgi:anti-sigma B factor antagonist
MLVKTNVERLGRVTVVTPAETSLDACTAGEFKREIAAVLASSSRLILDMTAVRYLDSAGCGAILTALRLLDQVGGDLKICSITEPVRAIFELSRMTRILDLYNSRDEALRAFARHRHP